MQPQILVTSKYLSIYDTLRWQCQLLHRFAQMYINLLRYVIAFLFYKILSYLILVKDRGMLSAASSSSMDTRSYNKNILLKQKLSWATLTNTCRTGRGIGRRPRPWRWGHRACGVGGGHGLGSTENNDQRGVNESLIFLSKYLAAVLKSTTKRHNKSL
jgi:hypothetical protein